jgi:hypothetical protein
VKYSPLEKGSRKAYRGRNADALDIATNTVPNRFPVLQKFLQRERQ